MKIFEDLDEFGNTMYLVEEGDGEVRAFATKSEREEFLWRRWLKILTAVLRAKQTIEALEWLWAERRTEMLLLMQNNLLTQFLTIFLPLDIYFYSLPMAAQSLHHAYLQLWARYFAEMALTLILTTSSPKPSHVAQQGGGLARLKSEQPLGEPPTKPSSAPRG